ncbi:MAG: HDIG domain-containing protein [Clostridia bacterium]|nr:HDIG domain-containing protein [Clostridia bacterium]
MKEIKQPKLSKAEIKEREAKKLRKREFTKRLCKYQVVIILTSLLIVFGMVTAFAVVGGTFSEFFDITHLIKYFALTGITIISLNIVWIYLARDGMKDAKLVKDSVILYIIIFVAFILSTVTARGISIYMVPLCMIGLLVTVLYNANLAIFINAASVLLFYINFSVIASSDASFALIVSAFIQLLATTFLIVFTKNSYTRLSYIWKTAVVALLIGFGIAFLANMFFTTGDVSQTLISSVWSLLSILLGLAIFMTVLPILEKAFRVYSSFKLDEICSSDSRLMKRLREEAPGTYNHSMAMATLAQECAIKIGENPALARACCLYHDIGKLKSPLSFTENQTGYNPHDDYVPEVSVRLITRHTIDGANIIKEAGLPEILEQIALEHHGTQTVGFFLNKTRGITEENIDIDAFRYDGPKPSTKISALVMIVDTIEAATRSMGIDEDETLFRNKIHGLIMDKMKNNQFSNTPITLKDLQDIEDTLIASLPKLYHKRIKYN